MLRLNMESMDPTLYLSPQDKHKRHLSHSQTHTHTHPHTRACTHQKNLNGSRLVANFGELPLMMPSPRGRNKEKTRWKINYY